MSIGDITDDALAYALFIGDARVGITGVSHSSCLPSILTREVDSDFECVFVAPRKPLELSFHPPALHFALTLFLPTLSSLPIRPGPACGTTSSTSRSSPAHPRTHDHPPTFSSPPLLSLLSQSSSSPSRTSPSSVSPSTLHTRKKTQQKPRSKC